LSGISTVAKFGSFVQKAKFYDGTSKLLRALNVKLLPTLGNPTIPIFKVLPGLPNKTIAFSSPLPLPFFFFFFF